VAVKTKRSVVFNGTKEQVRNSWR